MGRTEEITRKNEAECLYKTRQMNNGFNATIIAYRNVTDIDVQFEDGTVVEHRTYQSFKLGKIRNPNYPTKKK